jgi:hypothetical protein
VVVLLTMAKPAPGDKFRMPLFDMVVAPVAFAAWTFSLPGTPLTYFAGYDVKWNAAILVDTKYQGANPDSQERPGQ